MKVQRYDPKTAIERNQLKEATVLVRREIVNETGHLSRGINRKSIDAQGGADQSG
jgi:hypothetical protein